MSELNNDLKTILESETGLDWTVRKDTPPLHQFVAVSFQYTAEYRESTDKWVIKFDDKAPPKNNSKLGPIAQDHLLDEWDSFIQETYPEN